MRQCETNIPLSDSSDRRRVVTQRVFGLGPCQKVMVEIPQQPRPLRQPFSEPTGSLSTNNQSFQPHKAARVSNGSLRYSHNRQMGNAAHHLST